MCDCENKKITRVAYNKFKCHYCFTQHVFDDEKSKFRDTTSMHPARIDSLISARFKP